jgi:hypothetical protein
MLVVNRPEYVPGMSTITSPAVAVVRALFSWSASLTILPDGQLSGVAAIGAAGVAIIGVGEWWIAT